MSDGLHASEAATPAEPDPRGRQRLDEELREAGIAAADIVETIHDPLVVLTPDLRVQVVNPVFYETFRVSPEETTGRPIYELGNGQWDIPELHTLLEEILPENDSFNGYEVVHEFEDLGERVMLLNARRLDHLQLILLVITDITDRKQAEALRTANKEAEEAREEAEKAREAAEQAREAAEAAREVAEEASLVKSQFLATMSHELRTPLTGVIGFADLLETDVLGPTTRRQKETCSKIRRSAWHLVRIIDEILAYARSETGRTELRQERVPVTQVVRDIMELLDPVVDEHEAALRLTAPDEPVFVVTDRAKLTQIVTNLVGNALKFSASPVDIRLSVDDDRIQIAVEDAGPGIPADRQEEIFEPFTQLDATLTREQGGTGLGLAIARRHARLLGGDIEVHSVVGQGSTFSLRLPRSSS
jgi:two-component system, chemotaxis family, CheB/CheR fusion protein